MAGKTALLSLNLVRSAEGGDKALILTAFWNHRNLTGWRQFVAFGAQRGWLRGGQPLSCRSDLITSAAAQHKQTLSIEKEA